MNDDDNFVCSFGAEKEKDYKNEMKAITDENKMSWVAEALAAQQNHFFLLFSGYKAKLHSPDPLALSVTMQLSSGQGTEQKWCVPTLDMINKNPNLGTDNVRN